MEDKEILKWLEKTIEFKKQTLSIAQKLNSTVCLKESIEHLEPVVKELAKGLKEDIKMLEKIKKYYESKELTQGLILADEEREYLKNFIRPFRNEVEFITKNKVVHADDDSETNFQYLYIMLDHEYIQLPMFKKDTMYKGMALGYDYTLKELGITYE